jgi:hypothetical protein
MSTPETPQQPQVRVTLRAPSASSSSMEFPKEVQANIERVQAKPAEQVSPRQLFNEHQARENGTMPIAETASKPVDSGNTTAAGNESIAIATAHTEPTQSTDISDSREITHNTINSQIYGSKKPFNNAYSTLTSGLTDADRSAKVCSVWPPSGGYFNDFDCLSVKYPLTGIHQAKFNKAHKEKSIRYVVEAITSTLGGGVNAKDLVPEDFYFLMYWLRLVSYTKMQYSHTAVCKDEKHVTMVKGGAMAESTLYSAHIVSNTDLTEVEFNPEYLESLVMPHLEALQITLKPPTMGDIILFSEEVAQPNTSFDEEGNIIRSEDYDVLTFLGDLACYIKGVEGNESLTLMQKIEVVSDHLTLEALDELKSFAVAVSGYGVSEKIKLPCPTCGAMIESEVSIKAHSFL